MYTADLLMWLTSVVRPDPKRIILELGDHGLAGNASASGGYARDFWQSRDARHVCVDLNGRIGSILRLDLSRPVIVPGWCSHFNYVIEVDMLSQLTDGDGEPGSRCGIYECLRNAHAWCKTGGTMVHVISRLGARFLFRRGFAKTLARLNGYVLTRGPEDISPGVTGFALRKCSSDPFTTQADDIIDLITPG